MLSCLIHFPDREPRIVMHIGDSTPTPGELLITGWVVDRQAARGDDAKLEYDLDAWVKPIAA